MTRFVPYAVILTVGSKDTYEAFLKCHIKSEQDEEKLRQSKMDWRTTGAKSAPRQSGGLTHRRWRKSAPVASVTGATVAQVSYKHPPLAFEWSTPESQKVKLETELFELRELIRDTAKTLDGYDRLLKPYWQDKEDIEDAVRRTHGRGYADVLVFIPEGAPARKPLFDSLLALAMEWGPTKAERSAVQTRLSGYARQAKTIETELNRMVKKGKKHAQA